MPPGGLHMKHRYDLFEKYPDGSSLWRDSVSGFKLTRLRLQELSQKSENQHYAIDLTTGDVLAFISQRTMFMDFAHFRKLKDEARAMLLRYGRYGGRTTDDDRRFACSPKLVN